MRGILTTLAEVAGMAAVAAGCWLIFPPVGLIAAGIGLIVVGVALA
jgi:hypothetical protein